MSERVVVRRNEYHDSIALMRASQRLRETEGVSQAMVAMGTAANVQILGELGFSADALEDAGPQDLVVAVAGDDAAVEAAVDSVDGLFRARERGQAGETVHRSFTEALRAMPDALLCTISVPGEYAAFEARRALDAGLHVFVYSDNVPLEQDRALKELAREKGLLCMGPDCGVANVNGIALGTASSAHPGPIGIAGASGSGTQQVAVLADREGLGLSQAIGIGGKDLKDEVGGLGMLSAIDALEKDPQTAVIVLVSRTPGGRTLPVVLERVRCCRKPVVVYFIGGDPAVIERAGGVAASDSEDAAYKAVDLALGRPLRRQQFSAPGEEIEAIVERETARMAPDQTYLRGLFCGGTFCEEAMSLLASHLGDIHSNAPLRPELKLADTLVSKEHSIIDLGDEELTVGRPHPVINPQPVAAAILREGADKRVAVMLLDVILGPAIHPDPVGAIAAQIAQVKRARAEAGGYLSVVAAVCGTDSDPQNLSAQERKLRELGVVVMPTNAQAARLAGLLALKASGRPLLSLSGAGDPKKTAAAAAAADAQSAKGEQGTTGGGSGLFGGELKVINVGLDHFGDSLRLQGVAVEQVQWKPPAGGDRRLAELLWKMGM